MSTNFAMTMIREIPSKETISIRSEILRPGQDIANCIYPHDDDDDSFHLAAYIDNKQVSIVSFYKEIHPALKGDIQYRFRGMATLEDYRKMGLAASLLKYAFTKMNTLNVGVVWCNARINALGLYQNLGMKIASEEFDIPGIGPHLLLKKEFV